MTGLRLLFALVLLGVSFSASASIDAARQAMSQNAFDQAVSELDSVLANQPDNAEALFLKGLALAQANRVDPAVTVFERLTDQQPQMAEAWNNLGVLRARQGDFDAALTALERATQADPSHAPAQENLGDIYVAKARDSYSRAAELESDNEVALAKSQQLAEFIGDSSQGSPARPPAAAPASTNAAGETARSAPAQMQADSQASAEQALRDAISQWSSAWSSQNFDGYMAAYSDNFDPEGSRSQSAWRADRRRSVTSPDWIEVTISDFTVDSLSGDRAEVSFDQRYRASGYQDQERKRLTLAREQGDWQIVRER